MPETTARDVELLRVLYRMGFMTIEQAAACVYGNHNVAQRRLSALEAQGFLLSFPLTRGQRGQPTKVCFLNHKDRDALSQMLQQSLDPRNMIRSTPENAWAARHLLETNSVLATFIAACRMRGCGFDFIPEYWAGPEARGGSPLADEVQNPGGRGGLVRYRRDAVCCIGTAKGKALFEIEYDRGKEVIEGGPLRKVTVAGKLGVFLQSVKERRFERYGETAFFNHPFQTSRLLVVTTSEERLLNIAIACRALDTHGLVYLTTMDQVRPETVLGRVWRVPDGETVNAMGLVNHA